MVGNSDSDAASEQGVSSEAAMSEAKLRRALEEERNLERRLIAVRAKIGPLKRAFLEETKTYGTSNERLLHQLTHKD